MTCTLRHDAGHPAGGRGRRPAPQETGESHCVVAPIVIPQSARSVPVTSSQRISGLLALIFVLVISPPVLSQPANLPYQRGDRKTTEESEFRQLPVDTRAVRTLRTLRHQLDAADDNAAVETFRKLQTADPFSLVPDDADDLLFQPLFSVLPREFERLPPSVKRQLSDSWKIVAVNAFRAALREADWRQLVEVIHRYPSSSAAWAAQLLLARVHLDRGHRMAALGWLRALETEHVPVTVRRAAVKLLDRALAETDTSRQLPEGAPDPGEWPLPKHIRWRRDVVLSVILRRQIERSAGRHGPIPVTPWNAVAGQGVLFQRTLRGLSASDLESGRHKWHLPLSPSHLEHLNRKLATGSGSAAAEERVLSGSVEGLLFREGVVSRIAVDRQHIYTVLARPEASSTNRPVAIQQVTEPLSQLIAVDRMTGRRVWTAGGRTLEDDFGNDLAETWFAGPPVAPGSVLYSVVEHAGEVRQVALRSATGEHLSSTLLAFPDYTIDREPPRRQLAATPVWHQGILLCPTTTGWLVAVDSLAQSALWAARISGDTNGQRSRIYPTIQVVRSASVRPGSRICAVDRTAMVLSHDAGDLVFLDVLTGRRQRRSAGHSCFFLAVLPEHVIVANASPCTITCLDTRTRSVIWEHNPAPEDGIPTGRGIVRGESLLLATTTGSLLVLNTRTGALVARASDVLSRPVRGQLVEVPATSTSDGLPDGAAPARDVVFISPTRTIRLTPDAVDLLAGDPVAEIRRLLKNGRPGDAWMLLEKIPADGREAPAVNALRFRVACLRAVRGDIAAEIPVVLAQTDADKHLAKAIRLTRLRETDPRATAFGVLALVATARYIAIPVPCDLLPSRHLRPAAFPHMPKASNASDEQLFPVCTVALQTWAARMLDVLFQQSAVREDTALTESCAELPTNVLLQMTDPAVIPILQQRFSKETKTESSLHLGRHMAELTGVSQPVVAWESGGDGGAGKRSEKSDSPVAATGGNPSDGATASSLSRDRTQSGSHAKFYEACLRRLAATLAAESPLHMAALFSAGDEIRIDNIAETDRFRAPDWWDAWQYDDYTVVPFARPNSPRTLPNRLAVCETDDSFLGRLDLLIHRDPTRLLVRDQRPQGTDAWSVAGAFAVNPVPQQPARVFRAGSILLVSSSKSLTAVSVLEKRVLWQRPLQAVDPAVGGTEAKAGMSDIETTKTLIRNLQAARDVCVAGCGFRWICLQQRTSVEMIDMLTGLTRWSVSGNFGRCTACDSVVLLEDRDSGIIGALDPATGQRVTSLLKADEFHHILTGTGTEFVILEPGHGDRPPALHWKHPMTGTVMRRLKLPRVCCLQTGDASTLIAFEADCSFSVIDLRTGMRRSYPWTTLASDLKTENSDAGTSAAVDGNSWNPEQTTLKRDRGHLYLVKQPMRPGIRLSLPGHQLIPYGCIRVIDRSTGQHLWEVEPAAEGVVLMAQPGLPFLATLELASRRPQVEQDVLQLRCFHKRTGCLLIDQTFPSRYRYSDLRISVQADFSVAADIHGVRLRFERKDSSLLRPVDLQQHER